MYDRAERTLADDSATLGWVGVGQWVVRMGSADGGKGSVRVRFMVGGEGESGRG